MQNLINALLNFLFVGIPEETIVVLVTFVMLKRFDLIDPRRIKRNYKLLLLPIISVSFLVNIFRYIIIIPRPLMSFSALILFIYTIAFITKKTDKLKEYRLWKVIAFTLLSMIVCVVLCESYVPFYLSIMNISLNDIENDFKIKLILSITPRIFGLIILFFITYNKTYSVKLQNYLLIFRDKVSGIILCIASFLTLILWLTMQSIFTNYSTVLHFSNMSKVLLSTLTILLPTLFLCGVIFNYVYNYRRINKIETNYSNMLEEQSRKDG